MGTSQDSLVPERGGLAIHTTINIFHHRNILYVNYHMVAKAVIIYFLLSKNQGKGVTNSRTHLQKDHE